MMAIRWRRRLRLLPGLWLNLGKTGASASVGQPGATLNVSPRGARATLGAPGTGLSASAPVFRPPLAVLGQRERRGTSWRFVLLAVLLGLAVAGAMLALH